MIVLHNGCGANCFIFKYPSLFWALDTYSLSVRKLDGSLVTVEVFGVIVLRPPGSSQCIALWPSYYIPKAPHHTFSPNAIKYYLSVPSVITEHTDFLSVTISDDVTIRFPSLPSVLKMTGLDFFRAEVFLPPLRPLSETV
jgi:hypothetical protein